MCSLQALSQYGSGFQIKVISSLLTYKEFLLNIFIFPLKRFFLYKKHSNFNLLIYLFFLIAFNFRKDFLKVIHFFNSKQNTFYSYFL